MILAMAKRSNYMIYNVYINKDHKGHRTHNLVATRKPVARLPGSWINV